MWEICGKSLCAGEKWQGYLELFKGYEVPVTLLCGAEEGKTVLITAGNHADEYSGIAAAARAAAELDIRQMKGNVLLFHCVNVDGFWARKRTVPEDDFNLNSDYPGRGDGTKGERIADYFVKEIFPKVDFIMDLHSGSPMEPLKPLIFVPWHEKVREASLAAAKAMDMPVLAASLSGGGEYSYAAKEMGIPGFLLECCGDGHCHDGCVDLDHRNIRLLLAHLGISACSEERSTVNQKVYRESVYLESEAEGLWYPLVQEGDFVKKDQLLGYMEDFFGNKIAEYRAEDDGTVYYYTASLAVKPGGSLVAYGLERSVL